MMPRGRRRVEVNTTRCANCGKLLPAAMLQGFVLQLKRLHADLAPTTEPDELSDEVALRRRAQLNVLHARSTAEILIDDATHLLCEGHDVKKGPKRKPETGDPSTPPGVEVTRARKRASARPAPTALRAVE
jgi:hypothetical protein